MNINNIDMSLAVFVIIDTVWVVHSYNEPSIPTEKFQIISMYSISGSNFQSE